MQRTIPGAVGLMPEERDLRNEIDFAPDRLQLGQTFYSVLEKSCAAAARLTGLLFDRDAVPPVRLAYFTDPALNVGLRRSRLEVFEDNGTRGEAIWEHPHFLKYLRYFIYGPDLPQATISGFCDIVNDDLLTSGMQLDRLRAYARRAVRQHGLDARHASEEFYKLARECALDDHFARSVRDAARSTREASRSPVNSRDAPESAGIRRSKDSGPAGSRALSQPSPSK